MPRKSDPVDVRVGQRIRAYRLSKNMSQTELGQKAGVTFQQIQKYERGTNRVGSSRLKMISQALGVSVAALFGEPSEKQNEELDELLTDTLAEPYAAKLLRAFSAIKGTKQRLALLYLAETMAEESRRASRSERR